MKTNKKTRTVLLVTFASILAPLATAQVAGAANAASSTVRSAPPTPPSPPSVSAGARSDAAMNAASRPTGATHADGASSAAVRTDRSGVNSSADIHASATGQERGLAVANTVSGGAAASLNVPDVVHQIHDTSFAGREAVTKDVDAKIDATSHTLSDLRHSARELKGDARDRFNAAYDDVRAKEKALKSSLKEARKATEANWAEAQAKLASDYDAYAQAVASAEATTSATATMENK
jgi:hypothetical protein